MKRLICAKEIETLTKNGEKVLFIDRDTIITPSAYDAAKNAGIEFKEKSEKDVDSERIYDVIKNLMNKDMMERIVENLKKSGFGTFESDEDGLIKLVGGNAVVWKKLDTGNDEDKIRYSEIINDDDSSMKAGIMTMEKSSLCRDVECQEIYYITGGSLAVEKDGKTFRAKEGDCFLFKKGARLTLKAKDKAEIFYAAC